MTARLMVGNQPGLQLCRGLADWPFALPQSVVQPRVEQRTPTFHGGSAVGSCSLLSGDMVSPRAPPQQHLLPQAERATNASEVHACCRAGR